MYDIAPDVINIADACLGGLQGRSALLIGPEEQRSPYLKLLRRAHMQSILQAENTLAVADLLPQVQLVISLSALSSAGEKLVITPVTDPPAPALTAATIAQGCAGRHTPLFIFDLDPLSSVEELAGLLPAVCLYTPNDLYAILCKQKTVAKTTTMKAS